MGTDLFALRKADRECSRTNPVCRKNGYRYYF